VRPAIEAAEAAARRGQGAVVLLAYAATPAFDMALEVRPQEKDSLRGNFWRA